MVSQLKEAILCYLQLVRLYLEYHAQFCAPKYEADAEVFVEGSQDKESGAPELWRGAEQSVW